MGADQSFNSGAAVTSAALAINQQIEQVLSQQLIVRTEVTIQMFSNHVYDLFPFIPYPENCVYLLYLV